MKKHIVILLIFVVSALILGIGLYQNNKIIVEHIAENAIADNLDSSIESFGLGSYNAIAYKDLKMNVLAAFENQEITEERKKNLLIALEYGCQKALANGINQWFHTNCENGSIIVFINESKRFSSPIPVLRKEINEYNRYKAAELYNSRINALIAGPYDPIKNSEIQADFNSLITDRKFQTCPKIISIKNRIQNEIADFEFFYNNIWKPFESDSVMFKFRLRKGKGKYDKFSYYTKQ